MMYLKELIEFLAECEPTKEVKLGFGSPHSYRGYYQDLAFEPASNTTVGAMLTAAKDSLGRTFTGYKGGDYTMSEYTDIWLAEWGSTGEGIGPVLLKFMLGEI
jgi:hypothetical protein